MRVDRIISIANAAYPDGQVKQAAEHPVFAGDTLALFVVREIKSVYEPGKTDTQQLEAAAHAMETASCELAAVARAINKAALDIKMGRKQNGRIPS
jgi:hypothetical protein